VFVRPDVQAKTSGVITASLEDTGMVQRPITRIPPAMINAAQRRTSLHHLC
jgi:hypothetical protein